MDILVWPPGHLLCKENRFRCALGQGGVRALKREGDGATPVGSFPLRRVMYRADRLAAPATGIAVGALTPEDGWCDDPADHAYNRPVRLPYPGRHETLWRTDGLYDVIVELGYNDDPVEPGLGSAIFLHCAGPGYAATRGCVALVRDDLLQVLKDCDRTARLCVGLVPPPPAR